MTNDKRSEPVSFKGVMVSSTFTDLAQHREALIKAIDKQKLKAVAMENDAALPAIDLIDSSLQMVRDAAAYIGVISHKYGQIPECPERNPKGFSVTELEFNEARDLGRPILLFIMGDGHDVKKGDVETDPDKITKAAGFSENAKRMKSDSSVHRVYKVFNSLQEFEVAAMQSVAELRRYLDQPAEPTVDRREVANTGESDPIPTPPAFYAEPPYIGSHKFVGREAQLETLSDWAAAADPHPVLLFEAIGGAGKSMLTWEWTTQRAATVRDDWAGRFWYSFYEKGAIMADFCQRALAYITERPLKEFRNKKTLELSELLLHHLRARPWLIVLDGLERVLVAYHRLDAAQLADEEAGTSDQIAHRDPCAAIRPEDDDLLRAVASAGRSKLLLTSRLIPRVLLNSANQPIPGIVHERLPGLRPTDAEALLRSCGVFGTSNDIQSYLKSHCDCHPLVTGVLAGLINDYLPDRGNFDAWADDRAGGDGLSLADLDLVQKRNHILRAALDALPDRSRQLLATLALLSEAVDYLTLSALIAVPQDLTKSVRDLERRGLLQYDGQARRYDLHPVVRGIAAGGLQPEEKDRYGQRVVDHFSRQSHSPYAEAETLDDVRDGLHIVRTLVHMGHYQEAFIAYSSGLADALLFNLEAHPTILSIIHPFFPRGWAILPDSVPASSASYLSNYAGCSLDIIGEPRESLAVHGADLQAQLREESWIAAWVAVSNISDPLLAQNRTAAAERCSLLALDLAAVLDSPTELFRARLNRFRHLVRIGYCVDAEKMWKLLDPMGRDWPRWIYQPGLAEEHFAAFRFSQGDLKEEHLSRAERLTNLGRGRSSIRRLHGLRGEWQIEQGQWDLAASSLRDAVRMAREVGQAAPAEEAQLALANFHLGRLADPRQEAELLSQARNPAHGDLAVLWFAIGDSAQAKKHVLAAYKWAWADGEPYVRRYELNKARALLEQLGAEIPELPPYNPAKDEKLAWEDEVAAAIEKLRAEMAQETEG